MSENITTAIAAPDDRPEPDYKALWLDHLQQAAKAQANLMKDAERSALYRTSWLNPYDFTAKPVTEPAPEPETTRRLSLSWGWFGGGWLDEIEMSAHMHALRCHVTRFGARRATIDITGPRSTVAAFVEAVTKAVNEVNQ